MGAGNISGGSHGGGQDFDLNLAPIIDCLVVLITFMLASAAFLSIGILDAGISAGGAAQSSTAPPSVVVTLEMKKGHQMVLRIEGKENQTINIAGGTEWNLKEASERIKALRQKWTDLGSLTLQGDNDLEYKEFVQVMDSLRKEIPVVMLGGF